MVAFAVLIEVAGAFAIFFGAVILAAALSPLWPLAAAAFVEWLLAVPPEAEVFYAAVRAA